MKAADLRARRRRSQSTVGAGFGHPDMVFFDSQGQQGQEVRSPVPPELTRTLDADEISMLMQRRARDAHAAGKEEGYRAGVEEEMARRERIVEDESRTWVLVTIDLVLAELHVPVGGAVERVAEAVAEAPRAKETAEKAVAAHERVQALVAKLYGLKASVEAEGVS